MFVRKKEKDRERNISAEERATIIATTYTLIFRIVISFNRQRFFFLSNFVLDTVVTSKQHKFARLSTRETERIESIKLPPILKLRIHDLLLGCQKKKRSRDQGQYFHRQNRSFYARLIAKSGRTISFCFCFLIFFFSTQDVRDDCTLSRRRREENLRDVKYPKFSLSRFKEQDSSCARRVLLDNFCQRHYARRGNTLHDHCTPCEHLAAPGW